jgi:hypothetical protein
MTAVNAAITEFWTYVVDNIKDLRIHDLVKDEPVLRANRGKDLATFALSLNPSGVIGAKMIDLIDKIAKLHDSAAPGGMMLDFVLRTRTLVQLPADLKADVANLMTLMKRTSGESATDQSMQDSMAALVLKEIVVDATSLVYKPLIDRIVAEGARMMMVRYSDFANWRIVKHKVAHSGGINIELKIGNSIIPPDLLISWIDNHGTNVLITVATCVNITQNEAETLKQQVGGVLIAAIGHYLIEKHQVGIRILINPPIPSAFRPRCIKIPALIDTLVAYISANYKHCTLCGIHEYNCDISGDMTHPKGYSICLNCALVRGSMRGSMRG